MKNRSVVHEEKYYLLEKNTSQKKILSQLKSKEIYISRLNWLLASLFHEKSFIPKAGEYIIPKNFSVFEIQNIFQKGKDILLGIEVNDFDEKETRRARARQEATRSVPTPKNLA